MDFLENEYKKRFQNQCLSNDEIDTDDLWAAIEENLENPSPKPSNYWVWLKKYRFAVAAIMLLLSAVFIFQWANSLKEIPIDMSITVHDSEKQGLNKPIKKQTPRNTPLVNQSKNNLDNQKPFVDNNQHPTAVNTSSVNQAKNNLDSPKSFVDNNQHPTVENTPSVNQAENKLDNQKPFVDNRQHPTAINTPSVNQAENKLDNQKPFVDNRQHPTAVNTPSVNQRKNADLLPQKGLFEENKKENTGFSVAEKLDNAPESVGNALQNQLSFQKDTSWAALSFLPFLEHNIHSINTGKPLLDGVITANRTQNKRKRKEIDWQLGISLGLNTMKMNYASDSSAAIATLKNKTEKWQLGWNSSAHLTVLRNDKWRFSTGLAYEQYFLKLNFKQEKAIQVLKENQLLQVWINTSTGDTLQTRRGDTMINALSIREVVHYNTFQQLSIPFAVGIQNHSGNWIYGINIGAVLNFTLGQSGKLIDDKGEFQLFSNGDSLAPLRKSRIGTQISPFVGYAITKKWSIECHPQWSWQFNKSIGITGMKAQIHQFGLNIQSVWRF
jgi:hypothetical protein